MITLFRLAFVFLLCITAQASCDRCQALYNYDGQPSEALLDILMAFGICHDGSWTSIQQATETAWLSHGREVERWEIDPIADLSPEQTFSLFTRLSMTQTLRSSRCCYEYAVVLGATTQVVRQRFWFLKQEWERGIRFKTLVLLTGDRPLNSDFETLQVLTDPTYSDYPFREDWHFDGYLPQNETEMMQLVLDQLALPEEWRNLPLVVVDTPKPEGMHRPHTEHTLEHWLAMLPMPGATLFVSSQPFVCRQDALLRRYLPTCFEVETVGEEVSYEKFATYQRGTAILLAELAYSIKLHQQARALLP